MSFFGQTKRGSSAHSSRRYGNPLPLSNSDVLQEKFGHHGGASHNRSHHRRGSSFTQPLATSSTPNGWFTVLYIPIPKFLQRSTSSSSSASSPIAGLSGRSRASSIDGNGYYGPSGLGTRAGGPSGGGARQHVPLYLPIPRPVWQRLPGAGRPTPLKLCIYLFIIIGAVVVVLGFKKNDGGKTTWSPPFQGEPSTLVLTREEVARIWQWELLSGHHPSVKQIPESVPLPSTLKNPAVPYQALPERDGPSRAISPEALSARQQSPAAATRPKTLLVGSGPDRHYLPMTNPLPPWEQNNSEDARKPHASTGFPPRPVPGSIADLDLLLERCDFSTNQYVRDCLELLRVGGHLDNGRRLRRHNMTNYQYIYTEDAKSASKPETLNPNQLAKLLLGDTSEQEESKADMLTSRRERSLSRTDLKLPAIQYAGAEAAATSRGPCDSRYPRIFHMFWAGPFTDKPYMAVMSFLFTQNLGLDLASEHWNDKTNVCRPQFWVWINPGPAAAVPNPSAKREMYESLAINPWSAPFLHARFKDVVKFKMWNTTEQLDGIAELRDHWRDMPIFNSGGNKYDAPKAEQQPVVAAAAAASQAPFVERDVDVNATRTVTGADGVVVIETAPANNRAEGDMPPAAPTTAAPILKKGKGGLFEKVGSTSENDYDRLSVILSDMARFVLTHRYGGIYLDADTLFLRDWEELWNWKGQFAYRWSWHQKYNTAVLKLHKNSALSTFLFKAALENGLDFHPMTVSRYLKDADLDPLLFRIPDALFDPAWLNMEKYQRDRPPFPYFPEFNEFFSNNRFSASGPHPLGFDGFFRGAYSYHFHNFWWLPFDPSRNWPDLGPRFIKGERLLRDSARAAKILEDHPEATNVDIRMHEGHGHEDDDFKDEADLSWSTALKRTFEAYVRAERPNMYGEWLRW